MEEQCCAKVNGEGQWGSFNRHQCHKKAVVQRDGKLYCKIHDPEYRNKKYEDAKAKYEAKRELNSCKSPNCDYHFSTTGYEGLYRYCPFCGVKRV